MFGMTRNAVIITSAFIISARRTVPSPSSARMRLEARRGRGGAMCPRMLGIARTASTPMTTPVPATAKNGSRQPPQRASRRPSGTPSTEATENAPITAPMARPRRAGGMTSAMIDSAIDVAGPPNAPAIARASTSDVQPARQRARRGSDHQPEDRHRPAPCAGRSDRGSGAATSPATAAAAV